MNKLLSYCLNYSSKSNREKGKAIGNKHTTFSLTIIDEWKYKGEQKSSNGND